MGTKRNIEVVLGGGGDSGPNEIPAGKDFSSNIESKCPVFNTTEQKSRNGKQKERTRCTGGFQPIMILLSNSPSILLPSGYIDFSRFYIKQTTIIEFNLCTRRKEMI